jgi:hypothetical protein
MEQWLIDGRRIVAERGASLIPFGVESLGFTVDLSGCRGLLKKTVVAGNGETPSVYAECVVAYSYIQENGSVVDCSPETEPLTVAVGAGEVTQGFDEALLSMACGEEAEFWLDPAFAFRENGLRTPLGSIPPNSPLLLRLRLVRFENPLTSAQKIDAAISRRESGAEKFRLHDIEGAISCFMDGLRSMGPKIVADATLSAGDAAALSQRDAELRIALLTNLATCWFLKEENEQSWGYCVKALQIDPRCAKALFRQALIEEKRENTEQALALLQKMIDEQIGDIEQVEAALARIKQTQFIQKQRTKEAMRRLFAT